MWNIARINRSVTQRHEVSKCCWKDGTCRLARGRLPQTFSLSEMTHIICEVQ